MFFSRCWYPPGPAVVWYAGQDSSKAYQRHSAVLTLLNKIHKVINIVGTPSPITTLHTNNGMRRKKRHSFISFPHCFLSQNFCLVIFRLQNLQKYFSKFNKRISLFNAYRFAAGPEITLLASDVASASAILCISVSWAFRRCWY